jgi:hypothetical protein
LMGTEAAIELWRFDGQSFRPALRHIPGGGPKVTSIEGHLFAFGNQLLMTGDDGRSGSELWRIQLAAPGDANGDGQFDSSDLVQVFQAAAYESDRSALWGEGDWNGDGRFDSSDLVLAFARGNPPK